MIVDKEISLEIEKLVKENKESTQEDSIKHFSDGLAQIISDAIRSADVTVLSGIPVATAGSPTAQTGATTGIGKGSLK